MPAPLGPAHLPARGSRAAALPSPISFRPSGDRAAARRRARTRPSRRALRIRALRIRALLLRALPIAVALTAAATLPGCGRDASTEAAAPAAAAGPGPVVPVPPAPSPRPRATLEVTGLGDIVVELLPDVAPQAVAHFRSLVEQDVYDGTTFHRIVPGFMIQGGDPLSRDRDPRNDGRGGREYPAPDEPSELSFERGIVAFANTGRPKSGGTQLFVMLAEDRSLDGHYTIFGHVVQGMDVVDRIAAVERDVYGRYGPPDRPVNDVVIADVRIEEPSAAAAGNGSPSGGAAGSDAAAAAQASGPEGSGAP